MQGSCLCGAVAYEATQLDSPIQHCACHTCRKAHAAAFNTSAAVERAHFRWLRGEDKLKAFESSPGKLRHFCGECGTHLVAQRAGRDTLILRVATLDQDPGARPVAQIWGSHAAPWLHNGPDVVSYPEWEPGH